MSRRRPARQYSFGAAIYKDGVAASIGKSGGTRKVGSVELSPIAATWAITEPAAP